eukprot:GEMP01077464.1.p1 GENE.GEMP01077464.1~~GEMP01077464.1.p1  ORF type:complete len:258 (+),score=51.19 GEMP01077464.1:150-923(+)
MFAPGLTMRQIPSFQLRYGDLRPRQWKPLPPSQPQWQSKSMPQAKPRPKLQPEPQPQPQLQLQPQSDVMDLQEELTGKSGSEVIQFLTTVLSPIQLAAVTKVFSRRNAVQAEIQSGVPPLRRSLGTIDRSALIASIRTRVSIQSDRPSLTKIQMEQIKLGTSMVSPSGKGTKTHPGLLQDIRLAGAGKLDIKLRPHRSTKEIVTKNDMIKKGKWPLSMSPLIITPMSTPPKMRPGSARSTLQKSALLHTEIDWFASH